MAEDSGGQQVGFWMRFVTVLQTLLRSQQSQQQLEQFQRSDRQLADGFDRGADDPDNRRMQGQASSYNYDVVQQARVRVQEQGQQPTTQETGTSQQRPTTSQDTSALLRAQMEAFQQQMQAEQRRQQSRGQGRGL